MLELASSPDQLLHVLRDPLRISEWAPAFADHVEPLGDEWVVTKDARQFTVRVDDQPAAGTVDYLRDLGDGRVGGAYLRVIPTPDGGAVVTLTLPVPPGADVAEVAATAQEELARLHRLVR